MDGGVSLKVSVRRRSQEAEDVVAFELRPLDGGQLPRFTAGAHVDVEVKPGLVRQYSLCNDPEERDRYILGVLLEPSSRGGSAALHQVQEGAELRISPPRNHFELVSPAQKSLLFAGGIGVTPILCMAERLATIGADFEMHYCSRSRTKCAFHDRIVNSRLSGRVQFHFDDGPPSQILDIKSALGEAAPGTHVYVCGPAGFIDFVLNAAEAQGFARTQLHREYFNVDATQLAAGGEAFEVKLASSGAMYRVPEEKTILEVLRENGVEMPASCEQGICGICLTRVLEGVPDHRDFFLTDSEHEAGDQFTPCCSRSKTPVLVIDL